MGAPYDLYSLNDLERIKLDQYKLLVFLDVFYLSDTQRDYINGQVKGEGVRCYLSAHVITWAKND